MIKKPSFIELLPWCSRDHGRHHVILILSVLPGLLICLISKFWIPAWQMSLWSSEFKFWRASRQEEPLTASRITGHVLVSRSHTETPMNLHGCLANLQRRAVQYWRQQNAVSRNGAAKGWDSSTNSSSKPLLDQLVPYARGLWFVAGFHSDLRLVSPIN